jgi:hypothetical protein
MRAYAKARSVLVIPSHWRRSCCDSSENLSGWQAHDQILEYDFKPIVCGHVSRYGAREDVLIGRE